MLAFRLEGIDLKLQNNKPTIELSKSALQQPLQFGKLSSAFTDAQIRLIKRLVSIIISMHHNILLFIAALRML